MSRHELSDQQILRMLDMRDGDRITMAQIAERMGLSRGTIIGQIHRIKEAHEATPCRCKKARNKDGGEKRGWWRS